MTEVRRRSMNGDKKKTLDKKGNLGRSFPPQHSGAIGHRSIIVGVGTLVLLATYFGNFSLSPQANGNHDGAYALCSHNGNRILTVDRENTRVQCILVKDAHIQDVGSLADIKKGYSELAVRYIPSEAIAIPGISDAHGHVLEYGASRLLPLEGTKTIQDTVSRVSEHIKANPHLYNDTSKFVIGGGWDHTVWPTTRWPSAEDLEADPIVRGRPVVLQSKDCHALWISARALETSLPFPEDIEGGVIVRDPFGKPTGMLLDNAQELLRQPALTEADLLSRFQITVQDALSAGITSVHDAGLDPMSLEFFKRQTAKGPLPIRVYAMSFFDETEGYWGNVTKPFHDLEHSRLSARSVKMFADGALRTGGAALYEPYTDNPSTPGFMRTEAEVFNKYIPMFLGDGWQVNVHAIGDRANGIVIDAFQASLEGVNVTASRPRLEHAQIMTQEDMVRLGKIGVIASVQPTHATDDMWYAQDRLGPERVKTLYAFRTMIDSGARIALGTDFPVEGVNPLATFYAAVTRLSPEGKSPHGPEGWFPEQRLSREEALRGMTIDPTYASFSDDFLGSLEKGKRADFVILSRDIMSIPERDILSTRVLATVIDGKLAYGSF